MNAKKREKSVKQLIDNLELIMKVTYPHAQLGDSFHAKINSLAYESLRLVGSLGGDLD